MYFSDLSRGLRVLLVLASVFGLAACGSMKDSALNPMMPAAYVAASPEARDKHVIELNERAAALRDYKTRVQPIVYELGEPIRIGNPQVGFTMQWIKERNIVLFYPGHDPAGIDGPISEGMIMVASDDKGNIKYQDNGRGQVSPITFLANVATQEDVGRLLIKGGFQVLAGASNGLGAGLATGLLRNCGNNCGGSQVNILNNPQAGAISGSSSGAAIQTPGASAEGKGASGAEAGINWK